MTQTIGERIKIVASKLDSLGFSEYSEMLNDAYNYSSSSSEIYFKTSGILKAIINNCDIKDDVFFQALHKLKSDIDRLIR